MHNSKGNLLLWNGFPSLKYISMEIETINILLPLHIFISNRFSYNKIVFNQKEKAKKFLVR